MWLPKTLAIDDLFSNIIAEENQSQNSKLKYRIDKK